MVNTRLKKSSYTFVRIPKTEKPPPQKITNIHKRHTLSTISVTLVYSVDLSRGQPFLRQVVWTKAVR